MLRMVCLAASAAVALAACTVGPLTVDPGGHAEAKARERANAPRERYKAETKAAFDAFDAGDFARALPLNIRICEAEQSRRYLTSIQVARACYAAGLIYEGGWGVPQDFARAASFYQTSISNWASMGRLRLGALYAYGQGVPRNREMAREVWRADPARLLLDYDAMPPTLRDFHGVRPDLLQQAEANLASDPALAFKQFLTLAVLGRDESRGTGAFPPEPGSGAASTEAQAQVGIMLFNGTGVARNVVRANYWLAIAAKEGQASAQALLPRSDEEIRTVYSIKCQEEPNLTLSVDTENQVIVEDYEFPTEAIIYADGKPLSAMSKGEHRLNEPSVIGPLYAQFSRTSRHLSPLSVKVEKFTNEKSYGVRWLVTFPATNVSVEEKFDVPSGKRERRIFSNGSVAQYSADCTVGAPTRTF